MAKLTDIKITLCKPGRKLFPHVHFGEESCSNPRYYRSSYGDLETVRGSQFTINEIGPHNHGGLEPFANLARLFAAAPKMLALLDELVNDTAGRLTEIREEAAALVRPLMALDIPDADESGWGPYFNKDGTPWAPKP